jgi:hypothetical protein
MVEDGVLDFYVLPEVLRVDPARGNDNKLLSVRWTYQGNPDASSYGHNTHVVIPREVTRQPSTETTRRRPLKER